MIKKVVFVSLKKIQSLFAGFSCKCLEFVSQMFT